MAVKSLEVLKRNGYRPVNPQKKIPILTPLLVVGIQLISRFIVENHLRLLTEQVYNLYSRREAWADQATILIVQRPWPDDRRLTWKVSAGAFDYSQAPGYEGLRIVPGTERELRFTRDGCLLGYHQPNQRCLSPQAPAAPVEPADAGGAK